MAWMGKCINSRHHEPCEVFPQNIVLLMVGQKKLMPGICLGLATPLNDIAIAIARYNTK